MKREPRLLQKLLETSRGLIDGLVCNGYSLFSCRQHSTNLAVSPLKEPNQKELGARGLEWLP